MAKVRIACRNWRRCAMCRSVRYSLFVFPLEKKTESIAKSSIGQVMLASTGESARFDTCWSNGERGAGCCISAR